MVEHLGAIDARIIVVSKACPINRSEISKRQVPKYALRTASRDANP